MEQQKKYQPIEVWGGIECTINRVENKFIDQLECNGHYSRPEDLDLIASLGISTLRYPVLWEKVSPKSLEKQNWDWPDKMLGRLKELNINPIVGLLHHGSGPQYTSLTDPEFATKFATYAAMVAQRYPWLRDYTPINEPLTTARFSGLYGMWYPHGRDNLTFATCMINQCKGIVMAMQEIRKINPSARLIQTEDLGQTHSTALLTYQADFENERRWLTYDLLSGKVNPEHKMWGYLSYCGIGEEDLLFFLNNPCPPDIIGINHYITSERYLDEKLERYPVHLHGGNGRHNYVDTEAVRVDSIHLAGPQNLLEQTWSRYHTKTAVTEVHLGCTREEQIRWFASVWEAANKAKANGADICAITGWSMFGSCDWDSLLTKPRKHYESGIFDIRSPKPRPTAIAHLIKQLNNDNLENHPLLEQPGWWQREDRWIYTDRIINHKHHHSRPVLITGATGTLGYAFAQLCKVRGISYKLLSRAEMNITNPDQIREIIEQQDPWAIINTAGYVKVDQAEKEPDLCFHENTLGASTLATVCKEAGIQLVTFSSDLVFDGMKGEAYVEEDDVNPKNVYGASKAAAEIEVLSLMPEALMIRTSAFFGPWDEYNFITLLLRAFQQGQPFDTSAHNFVSPTYVPDLVNRTLDLLIDKEQGLWHLANKGSLSWAELGKKAALQVGISKSIVNKWFEKQLQASKGTEVQCHALASNKAHIMPELDSALTRYLNECTQLPLIKKKLKKHTAIIY